MSARSPKVEATRSDRFWYATHIINSFFLQLLWSDCVVKTSYKARVQPFGSFGVVGWTTCLAHLARPE
jgi:hypothetical protein